VYRSTSASVLWPVIAAIGASRFRQTSQLTGWPDTAPPLLTGRTVREASLATRSARLQDCKHRLKSCDDSAA